MKHVTANSRNFATQSGKIKLHAPSFVALGLDLFPPTGFIRLQKQDGIRSLKPVKIKVTAGIRVDCAYITCEYGCPATSMRNNFIKLARAA